MDETNPTAYVDWIIRIVPAVVVIILFWITANRNKASDAKKQGIWEGATEEKQSSLKKLVEKISEDVSGLREEFVAFRSRVSEALRMRDPLLDGKSPLSLTKLGQKVAKDINAEDEAEKYLDKLRARAGSEEPYDIQEMCLEYFENEYKPSEDAHKLIRTCAFDNGLSETQVRRVIGIIARDTLLGPTSDERGA